MDFLVVADPADKLNPKSDTTLSMVREALQRGHVIRWTTAEDLYFWGGRVFARSQTVEECQEGALPRLQSEREDVSVNSCDGVWIRKDPPFDSSYTTLCWLLALEENNVAMLNRPSLLLRFHEKMLPWEALERGFLKQEDLVPTFLPTGRQMAVPKNFPRGEAVAKPWLGHGGKGVEKLESAQTPKPLMLLQPYLPKVQTTGDRRVFFLDGKYIGDFVRLPAEGRIQANLAQGGKAVLRERTKREMDVCGRVGEFLQEIGIVFAGVDLLDERVSEINITSPTGFEALRSLGGPRLAPKYLDYVENLL